MRNDLGMGSGFVERFEDLIAWQKARELTREVYQVTRSGAFSKDYGLRDQIREASVSVMSNIAEGFERARPAEFQQFLLIAKGSCGEVRSRLYVALDAVYLDPPTFERLKGRAIEVSRLIAGLHDPWGVVVRLIDLSPVTCYLSLLAGGTPVKNVLLLGASGQIAPNIIPGLEQYYNLRLADIQPYPDGRPILTVDVTDYEQVREAARGMDAIANFTVIRPHPVLSFEVNTKGAFHVMKAAAELGIKKVLHTGPELIIPHYHHDFDVGDVPQAPSTGYYFITKYLSMEICKIYARAYGIQTICYQFNRLGPTPAGPISGQDFPPFMIVWEDLVEACRLALEIESVPGHFQSFILHSHLGQGKYSIEKARRILGYEPRERVEQYYRRRIQ